MYFYDLIQKAKRVALVIHETWPNAFSANMPLFCQEYFCHSKAFESLYGFNHICFNTYMHLTVNFFMLPCHNGSFNTLRVEV